MATKAKSSATPNPAATGGNGIPLGQKLSEALALLHGGKLAEAEAALTALLPETKEASNFAMARTIRTTLTALEARKPQKDAKDEIPGMAAVVYLNRHEPEAALEAAEAVLKADPSNARMQYIKATALALTGKAEASAEALQKAVTADPGILVLFRLERDFDGVRYGAAFEDFDRD